MRNLMAFFLILLIVSSAFSQRKSMDKLQWLDGRWDRTGLSGKAQAFEEWQYGSGAMTGIGAMLEDGDTVFVERLSIRRKTGKSLLCGRGC